MATGPKGFDDIHFRFMSATEKAVYVFAVRFDSPGYGGLLAQNDLIDYRKRVNSWREAENIEERRQSKSGRRVIQGKVSASYPDDGYIFGREFDIVSIENGHYFLTEVKFKPYANGGNNKSAVPTKNFCTNLFCKAYEGVGLGRWGVQLFTIYRQASFDFNVPNELTLSGRNIPGGEVVLRPNRYSINWILINKKGKGFSANIDDNTQMQRVINEVTGQK